MPHSYRLTLQSLSMEAPEGEGGRLTFDVADHDELFHLDGRVAALGVVAKEETAQFTIALKLFNEVMLRHRREPMFADFFVHFGAFMKRFKSVTPVGSTPA
jgi:hypothetical protein